MGFLPKPYAASWRKWKYIPENITFFNTNVSLLQPIEQQCVTMGGVKYCLKIVKNKLVINIVICKFVIW